MFLQESVQLIPVINAEAIVVDFVIWNEVVTEYTSVLRKKSSIDLPVVIMAGGKGARLELFIKILPKSLRPIGDKPLMKVIIDEFRKQGVKSYYLTLNYKGEMIKSYFDSIKKEYLINYIWEQNFHGIADCLSLLKKRIEGDFIVTNCNLIVKANYEETLRLHVK